MEVRCKKQETNVVSSPTHATDFEETKAVGKCRNTITRTAKEAIEIGKLKVNLNANIRNAR